MSALHTARALADIQDRLINMESSLQRLECLIRGKPIPPELLRFDVPEEAARMPDGFVGEMRHG